ncbi:hypothetical protein GCM10010270_67320 [Streptomyces violaceus]|nr:hypothetical protein GCM10010270_67320 [Streptomyces janthinus]
MDLRGVAASGTLPHCLEGAGGAPTRRTGRKPKYVQYEGFRPALPQPSAGGTPRARTGRRSFPTEIHQAPPTPSPK